MLTGFYAINESRIILSGLVYTASITRTIQHFLQRSVEPIGTLQPVNEPPHTMIIVTGGAGLIGSNVI